MSIEFCSSESPLSVETTRSSRREALHRVIVVCCDSSGGILGRFGDPTLATYERSLAKPLQLLTAIGFRPSLLNECSDAEIAVMSSSHGGEPDHITTIRALLQRHDLTEDLFLCGSHPPLYQQANWDLGRNDIVPTPIYHNCSGKHTGMLLACQEQGWSYKTYNQPDHSIQVAIRKTMGRYGNVKPEELEYGIDGCGVPTWWMDMKTIAVASARFADPGFGESEFEKKIRDRILEAFHKASWFTAGSGRFGTPFNKESDGKWLGKIGGEAVFGVSFRDRGIGIGLKVIDGNSRAIAPALLYTMKKWGLIEEDQLSRLRDWVEVEMRNAPGTLVGYARVVEL